MLRRFLSFTLAVALIGPGTPLLAAPAAVARSAATGEIAGIARDAAGLGMPNTIGRLRDVLTGQLAGSTMTNAAGQFGFAGLNSGMYVVEVVNAGDNVVATSAVISLTTGRMAVAGVSVTAPAAAAAAQAGPGGAAGFLTSTAGIVTLVAIGAGVIIGVYEATKSDASSSR